MSLVRPVLVLLLVAGAARAGESQRARLSYDRGLGAERCPDEDELRSAVAAELGYDPFEPEAEQTMKIRISRVGDQLVATIELVSNEQVTGRRELASGDEDCRELSAALALAIGIAIDPVHAGRPRSEEAAKPKPEPTSKPAPSAVATIRTPPREPQPAPTPIRVRVAGGALAAVGTAPAPAAGVWAYAGARWPRLSLGLEGRADFAASKTYETGTVGDSLLLGTLLPCWHVEPAFACAIASAGALQGSGRDVDRPRKATTFFAAAGVRVGIDLPFGRVLALTAHVDVRGNLTRTSLELDGRDVWTTPPVSADAALGVRAQL